MEILTSSEFGRLFFAFGTVIVLVMLWFGYYRSVFVPWLAWLVTGVLVIYMTTFLGYRYATNHMREHMAHEPLYIFLASVHGTISLIAIVLASVMFLRAARTQTYFEAHPKLSIMLALLWPAALISGLLV